MQEISSYPKIYNLGHREVAEITQGPLEVEEKLDGSQFSWGVYDGILRAWSRNQELSLSEPGAMFAGAVATISTIQNLLRPGWTYRGEVLSRSRHNVLTYARAPKGNVVLFDVMAGEEYGGHDLVATEGSRLGLEIAPLLYSGVVNEAKLRALLTTVSFLGGVKIEGVVMKPLSRRIFGRDGKPLMAKYVSELFREIAGKGARGPGQDTRDVLERVAELFRTEARWQKAVQHLRDQGEIADSSADIGPLIKAVVSDISVECAEEIRLHLWLQCWPLIRRLVVKGLAEWYKEQLLLRQFADEEVPSEAALLVA